MALLLYLGTLLCGGSIGVAGTLLPAIVKREHPERADLFTGVYTMALCLGAALAAGLNRILATQNRGRDRRSHGGWGYFSNRLDNEDRFSRASVSVWMIMALESAKLAGVSVPEHRLESARGFFERLWNARRGYFHYNLEPGRLSSDWPTLPASTPASVFALQLLGVDPTDAQPEPMLGTRRSTSREEAGCRRPSNERPSCPRTE